MGTKFERYLIEQCAPTLAGIKLGSLFHYRTEHNEDMRDLICGWNRRLAGKGLHLCQLRGCDSEGLVYVFRPAMLEARLSDCRVCGFLRGYGYPGCTQPDTFLDVLRRRLEAEPSFPHEIGVFLGYPLEDVQGFIEHNGKNYCMCGLWKVYGEQQTAKKLFERYKICKAVYRAMFEKGRSILQLTVAA